MIFKMHSSGLHYFEPINAEDIWAPFNKQQILSTDKAQNFYAGLAFPSLKDYKWILHSRQVDNYHISLEDAEIAKLIWGPNTAALKRKTACTKLSQ